MKCPFGLCDGEGWRHILRGKVDYSYRCECHPEASQESKPKRTDRKLSDWQKMASGETE